MMKVYFGQPWGGLGDNLQFTTLPKLFSKKELTSLYLNIIHIEILRYMNSVGERIPM